MSQASKIRTDEVEKVQLFVMKIKGYNIINLEALKERDNLTYDELIERVISLYVQVKIDKFYRYTEDDKFKKPLKLKIKNL